MGRRRARRRVRPVGFDAVERARSDPAVSIAAAYEAALAKLEADPRIPADRKPAIRAYQQGQLARLRAAR